jgi:pyruvate formate lyase activating enzyme
MRIASLQRVSLIDYPGKIAATVFTQGCNFRCGYCHNAELVLPDRYGPLTAEDDIFSFLKLRRGKLEGVVVTGGEPTIQDDLGEFLRTVKDIGYLVKLDTNGSNPGVLETLIEGKIVDYIAMDLKGPLERYPEIASVPVDTAAIERSIELIMACGVEHEFRTTVVKSHLDSRDLLSVAKVINKARLYVLQPFVPRKMLDDSFLSEATYLPHEFSAIREELGRVLNRVEIR